MKYSLWGGEGHFAMSDLVRNKSVIFHYPFSLNTCLWGGATQYRIKLMGRNLFNYIQGDYINEIISKLLHGGNGINRP